MQVPEKSVSICGVFVCLRNTNQGWTNWHTPILCFHFNKYNSVFVHYSKGCLPYSYLSKLLFK